MSEFLLLLSHLDEQLFYYVNMQLAAPGLDPYWVWITTKQSWYIPGACVLGWQLWKDWRGGLALIILIAVAITLSDQLTSGFLKPFTERMRPCKSLDGFRLLTHCGSLYGFPSSHASTSAAIATLFIGLKHRAPWIWVVVAFLIGISRVFVGVHYPGDVLAGWIVGIIVGWLVLRLAKSLASRIPLLEHLYPDNLNSGLLHQGL